MSIANGSKKNSEKPVNCPYCSAIQTKRGFLVMILIKDRYFLAKCWRCYEEFIVDKDWKVRGLTKT